MKAFITGGAGFIGSNLVADLIKKGHSVTVYDNFSTGSKSNLSLNLRSSLLNVIKGDVLNRRLLSKSMTNHDIVYHFCANSDVRKGSINHSVDFKQNTLATFYVLECMRKHTIKKIIFPSSMTVYGIGEEKMINEKYGPCLPISLYGATKLACEGLISAYSSQYGIESIIIRFANVIGAPATHGVIYDIINKLHENQSVLEVLGDGNQKKPYLYIQDAVGSIKFLMEHKKEKIGIYNVGTSDSIIVKEIVKIIIHKMKLRNVLVKYQDTPYGWKGDVPKFSLDVRKLSRMGFIALYSSRAAVEKATQDMLSGNKITHAQTTQ